MFSNCLRPVSWFIQTCVHPSSEGFCKMLVSSNMESLGCSTDIHTVAVAFELINYIIFFY